MNLIAVIVFILVSTVSLVSADGVSELTGDTKIGLQAYMNDDYHLALEKLAPLAKQGNSIAQYVQ